jgi:threonine dehydrogenase-like Zn-dependent dehydrogenase
VGSVLVKTEIAALCVDDRMYTDHIHEWFDSPLYGMGHEGVGTVLEAPESPTFKSGDRVLISHEFPMPEAEEALKISVSQQCDKILLYPHRH